MVRCRKASRVGVTSLSETHGRRPTGEHIVAQCKHLPAWVHTATMVKPADQMHQCAPGTVIDRAPELRPCTPDRADTAPGSGYAREDQPHRQLPALDSEVGQLLTGRAIQTRTFRAWAVLGALSWSSAVVLVIWATCFSGSDGSRSAQIAWAIVLPLAATIGTWLLARSGTAIDRRGLIRTSGLKSDRIAWADIERFKSTMGSCTGLWVVTKTARTYRIPTALHTMRPKRAVEAATSLNRTFGCAPDPDPICRDSPCTDARGALNCLRTVEFRQTLRGYHIDDVDEYLERVAVEVDTVQELLRRNGITVPAGILRPIEGHIPDTTRSNETWGYEPPTSIRAAAPPTAVADRRHMCVPDPGTGPALTLSGRSVEASGFWAFTVALTALMLVVPTILVTWGVCFGSSDRARTAQVVFGLLIGAAAIGLITRFARTGTSMDAAGLTRVQMFRRLRLSWEDVREFTGHVRGRPGLWVVPDKSGVKPVPVPSTAHTMSVEEADALASKMNRTFGFEGDAAGDNEFGGRDALESWSRWWFVPLATVGFASPFVLLTGAIKTGRRWLWLAAVAEFDVWTCALIGGSPDTGLVDVFFWLVLPIAPAVWMFVVWNRARRARGAGPGLPVHRDL
jgi:DivIVA domain-containing protein